MVFPVVFLLVLGNKKPPRSMTGAVKLLAFSPDLRTEHRLR